MSDSGRTEVAAGPGVFRRGLVEFVVIVVGVLVALGLESWWQGQEERRLEGAYLEALVEEAETSITSVEGVVGVSNLKRRWLERARIIFEAGLVADSAALFLEGALQGSGVPVVPQLSDAVLQDLLSTGRLSLIRDDGQRQAIIRGYSNIDAMLERRDRANANVASGLHALASRHLPVGAVEQFGPRMRVPDVPERRAELRRAAIALAGEPTFAGELGAAFRVLDHERNVLEQLRLAIEDQLTVLRGGERRQMTGFREMIEQDSAQFVRPPPSDSSGPR